LTFDYLPGATHTKDTRIIIQNNRQHPTTDSEPEDIMKTYAAVIATMVLAATASAQTTSVKYFADETLYSSPNVLRAERGYVVCLGSENDGVIESALAHITMMRLMNAIDDNKTLQTKVAVLARTASSAELRYKAFLTKSVLENPAMFKNLATTSYDTPDELFGAVASRMSEYYAAN
jgi:hypothetical protein